MTGKPELSDGKAFFQAAQEEHEQFVRALGALTLAWANAEAALYNVLRTYAGVSDGVARALFSGSRARAMMDFITAIAQNTNLSQARSNDLREVFSQLGAINTMRDRLTHHVDGSEQRFHSADPTKRVLSDARRAKRLDSAYTIRVGSADITAMCKDLEVCCWRLVAHLDETNNPFICPHFAGSATQPPAWLYKSPQPETQNPKSALRDQKPKRQPTPSREKQQRASKQKPKG